MKLLVVITLFCFVSISLCNVVCPDQLKWCDDTYSCIGPDETCSNDCPSTKPYKCPSGDCAKTPGGCCEDREFFCYLGQCTQISGECSSNSSSEWACPSEKPIRCPNGQCAGCDEDCDAFAKCDGKMCPDRTCSNDFDDCLCPYGESHEDFLFMCDNMDCTVSNELCLQENYCPNWRPDKCRNNTCVDLKKNSDACGADDYCTDTDNYVYCESDHSCLEKGKTCPKTELNGCPTNQPVRCLTGECVAAKWDCPNPYQCRDTNYPYRCEGGLCAEDEAHCDPFIEEEYQELADSYCINSVPYLCRIGICVHDEEFCPAINPCPCGTTRRSDGTCRDEEDDGGNTDTCTPLHPHRCLEGPSTGMCVDRPEQCLEDNSCTEEYPYKCDNGECQQNYTDCDITPGNGCPKETPWKCGNGRCVAYEDRYYCKNEYDCPIEKPIRCRKSGICVEYAVNCTGEVCPGWICASGACVDNRTKCQENAPNGCYQTNYPYLCADGECVESYDRCKSRIYCDDDFPVLCWNGYCVKNESLCPARYPCPYEKPYRCWDQQCSASKYDCGDVCPTVAPVRCESGACVTSSRHCPNVDPSHCPDDIPYLCSDGACVGKATNCTGDLEPCSDGKTRCWNGKCVLDTEIDCPIYDGQCPVDTPKRCKDGSCIPETAECDSYDPDCDDGEELCPDGICREGCGPYDGCPVELPIYCPDFTCTDDPETCYEDCSTLSTKLYRCFDYTCVEDPTDCPSPSPILKPECISFIHDNTEPSFGHQITEIDTSEELGVISGEGGSLPDGDEVWVCSKPDSFIRNNTRVTINIRSTIFDVQDLTSNDTYSGPITLTFNTSLSTFTSDNITDFCLGTVVDDPDDEHHKFKCISNLTLINEHRVSGEITENGEYFVMDRTKETEFWCDLDLIKCPDSDDCAETKMDCPDTGSKSKTGSDSSMLKFSSLLFFVSFFYALFWI
ncbi:hypothetical protein M0813_28328 [Anaeramoeba flamelloides]|uniref:Uncharacterized protein n=1 Tax=Anaeramoeba flamelloides TaxID=1746091 RepID=A0ABQ8XTW2_9EUKA|nr:hypothetical protein M0813_28328 [Anaeramoeba flamelloides]